MNQGIKMIITTAAALFALAPAAHAGHAVPLDASQDTVQVPFNFGPALPETSLTADCVEGMAGPYPCDGLDLKGTVLLPALGGPAGNDIWGWSDRKTGRDYAIMGTTNSVGFVDVTKATQPKTVATMPTAGTPDYVLWRDVKVDGNHLFVVAEVTGAGMQVFDLRRLRKIDPDAPTPEIVEPDAHYTRISNTHNISVNERTDYAYAVGSDKCRKNGEAGGLHMIDVSKPEQPDFAGCARVDSFAAQDETEPNNYVHDVECVIYRGPDADYRGREICFGSNENAVVIYDVTNKRKPKVISETTYDTAQYTHQGSLTKGQRFFLFGDELDEQTNGQPTTTYILDVRDLDNPPEPKSHFHESASIDHNLYVHGRKVTESNYAEGLRMLRYTNRSLRRGELREIAFFDVLPGVDVAEFAGTWSNYRFPDGKIVVSTLENAAHGLMVLKRSKR